MKGNVIQIKHYLMCRFYAVRVSFNFKTVTLGAERTSTRGSDDNYKSGFFRWNPKPKTSSLFSSSGPTGTLRLPSPGYRASLQLPCYTVICKNTANYSNCDSHPEKRWQTARGWRSGATRTDSSGAASVPAPIQPRWEIAWNLPRKSWGNTNESGVCLLDPKTSQHCPADDHLNLQMFPARFGCLAGSPRTVI